MNRVRAQSWEMEGQRAAWDRPDALGPLTHLEALAPVWLSEARLWGSALGG